MREMGQLQIKCIDFQLCWPYLPFKGRLSNQLLSFYGGQTDPSVDVSNMSHDSRANTASSATNARTCWK